MANATAWSPLIHRGGRSIYLEIAEAIERDVVGGILKNGDRLPTLRDLAARLGVDYTTISRGYYEASRRGLIETCAGRGTFVRVTGSGAEPPRIVEPELSMNLPPEVTDPDLLAAMQDGLANVSADLPALLRYQSPTGNEQDKAMAARWLARRGLSPALDCIAITPGAQPTLITILALLARAGDTVLCEELTYPGLRSIAARMNLRLIGVPEDFDGIRPDRLEAAIEEYAPRALFLNPTLQIPTTRTMQGQRRRDVAEVLRRHQLPLIEDDPYGMVVKAPPETFAALMPELTWHVATLGKTLGGGLRLAYTHAPDARSAQALAQSVRVTNVMVSPLATALAGAWVASGVADRICRAIREEANVRQALAREILGDQSFASAPEAYNIWITLPPGVGRADVMGRMAGRRIGLMPSDAFATNGMPGEQLRLSLGGPQTRDELRQALTLFAETLHAGNWVG